MSDRVWIGANVSLGVVAVLLLLLLFNVSLLSVGRGYFGGITDQSRALCAVQWREDSTELNDMDFCCVHVREQLECSQLQGFVGQERVDWDCHTGSSEPVVHYMLNARAYRYCQGAGIGVPDA